MDTCIHLCVYICTYISIRLTAMTQLHTHVYNTDSFSHLHLYIIKCNYNKDFKVVSSNIN